MRRYFRIPWPSYQIMKRTAIFNMKYLFNSVATILENLEKSENFVLPKNGQGVVRGFNFELQSPGIFEMSQSTILLMIDFI